MPDVFIDEAEITSIRLLKLGTAPAAPDPDSGRLYLADDDALYIRLDDGTVVPVASGGGGSPAALHGASVYSSASHYFTTTPGIVTWNNELFDSDDFHDNVTNNSRITVPSAALAGLYHVTINYAHAGFTGNANSRLTLTLLKNGSALTPRSASVNANGFAGIGLSETLNLAEGDYIELQSAISVGSWNAVGGVNGARLTVIRLGDTIT